MMNKSEHIEYIRQLKYIKQGGCCAHCGKPFLPGERTDLAHILPQRKWLIAKYGEEIIHHELNMALTHHSDICNSGVQISPNKTAVVDRHVQMIKDAISTQSSH